MPDSGLPLVLASSSPRRSELLRRLGIELIVAPAHVDETPWPDEAGPVHALRVADAKADAALVRHADHPILAADTVVVCDGRIFGKPRDRADAAAMLRALAGTTHVVATAVAARWQNRKASHLEVARVTFVPFDTELYGWYLATGEGDDKAGAYAVQGQGAVLVERVEGNVQAVVGLPLAFVPGLLCRVGLRLVARGGRLDLESLAGTEGNPPSRGSSSREGMGG
ncbi:MAG TPA: nucleoside triphosphate pyrophosphatase [Thermoanaerobaculaceae bacterium]|nr:nucleoside triphosphate pyrophosphatase [Thermoanaerobaculaceae bacterium]